MTQQPVWKCIEDTLDLEAIEGEDAGHALYVDETGVYPPELELPYPIGSRWVVYTVLCEPLKLHEGQHLIPAGWDASWPHPAGSYVEWFSKDLGDVAECVGIPLAQLQKLLCSTDPRERAGAYRDLVSYFGPHEFDQYPNGFETLDEVARRYQNGPRKVS